jgi:hypothetical protein
MEDQLLQGLKAAVDGLSWDCNWLQLLAENLFCSSCEGFIQSSVLGAFNARRVAVGRGLLANPGRVGRVRMPPLGFANETPATRRLDVVRR